MSNTTQYPQPIYELVQTLLDVRNQMEDVKLEAHSLGNQYGDAYPIYRAAEVTIFSIDQALDLIKYNEG